MSIADKVAQLTTIRGDIRNALIEKEVDASTHNFSDFAEDILSITGGGTVTIPTFTYTGQYELITEENGVDWKLKLKSSGNLIFSDLGSPNGVDIFVVGGGGGAALYSNNGTYGAHMVAGGGGGYTTTEKSLIPVLDTTYTVTIGSGGTNSTSQAATDGTTSSIVGTGINVTANGGQRGNTSGNSGAFGGAGGSGGSIRRQNASVGDASGNNITISSGANGGNGRNQDIALSSSFTIGVGQGTTTKEFGEVSGELYAYGGGGTIKTCINNTGNGATWINNASIAAATGIIIIRNHREYSHEPRVDVFVQNGVDNPTLSGGWSDGGSEKGVLDNNILKFKTLSTTVSNVLPIDITEYKTMTISYSGKSTSTNNPVYIYLVGSSRATSTTYILETICNIAGTEGSNTVTYDVSKYSGDMYLSLKTNSGTSGTVYIGLKDLSFTTF